MVGLYLDDLFLGSLPLSQSPVVNFINILQTAFALTFFCQKITKRNCN